ncbi:putative membrane protein [Clostridium saccharobutylicum]|uniref:hypothetical protein n=1 Tax=Clostridium saccharobutylicum TaxID=169679 RepID=UPI0014945689|nr:hypothetical protein [Clostridium saccharobutylicum]NOV83310.1 putative membrane protein [Clostridium saccharobutylicum]
MNNKNIEMMKKLIEEKSKEEIILKTIEKLTKLQEEHQKLWEEKLQRELKLEMVGDYLIGN